MPDDLVSVPRRRPGPRPPTCAVRRVTITVMGDRQIDTWEALCAQAGRAPHELASDVVLAAIRWGQHDHQTQDLVAAVARHARKPLLYGGPRSRIGRREMLAALDGETWPREAHMYDALAAALEAGR